MIRLKRLIFLLQIFVNDEFLANPKLSRVMKKKKNFDIYNSIYADVYNYYYKKSMKKISL